MSQKKTTPNKSGASPAASRREQLRLRQEAEAKRARSMKLIGIIAALLALVLVGVVATVLVKDHNKSTEAAATQITPPDANSDKSGIVVNPGKAKSGAPTLVVYQDYQCPSCKAAEDQFGTIVNDLAAKGDISLEYRTMTFLDTNLKNDSSIRSGIAAACADSYGASVYEKYHDTVYANQPTTEGQGYTDQQLSTDFAKTAGITGDNLTKFQACYNTKATQTFVEGTNDAAGKAGISSTPTYQVNGNKLDLSSVGTTEASFLAAVKKAA